MTPVVPWLIHIEGAHRVGKDTLGGELLKQSDYSHVVTARAACSNHAFAHLFGRSYDLHAQLLDLSRLQRFLIVVLNPPLDTSLQGALVKKKHGSLPYSNSELNDQISYAAGLAEGGYGIEVRRLTAWSHPASVMAEQILQELFDAEQSSDAE